MNPANRVLPKLPRISSALVGMLLVLAPGTLADDGGVLWRYDAQRRIDAVAISRDGSRIALGSRDNTLRLFDRTGVPVWAFEAESSILDVAMTPDGRYAAVASEDRNAYLLDETGDTLWSYRGARSMSSVGLAEDGSLVAAACQDRSVAVLDGEGALLWREDVGIEVGAVAIYGTGEKARVVVGAEDGSVVVYSRSGDPLLQTRLGYEVLAIAVTPNGARIVAGCADGGVYLLSGSTGAQLWSFMADDQVLSVDLAADGRTVLAGSEDRNLYLLDGEGALLQTWQQEDEVLGVAISGDGTTIASGNASGAALVLDRAAARAGDALRVRGLRERLLGIGGALALLLAGAVWAVRRTVRGRVVWQRASARPRGLLRAIWRARLSYALLLPTVTLLLVFNYYPALSGLLHAFTDWNPGGRTEWVGLDNFRYMLSDRFFWAGFTNMFILVATGVFKTLSIPLLVAELLFNLRNSSLRYVLRTLFVAPIVLPLVVEILVWNNIYDPTIGLLNQALTGLGAESWARVWYGDPSTALASIIFVGFPWVGAFPLLIFYGGLISIASEVFDAAQVDGATGLKRFWYVDLPLLLSQVKLLVILTFISSVQTFELVYLTTGGGPGSATYTPALELYYAAMRMDMLGLASAIGMVLFAIILVGTIINMRSVRSSTEYEA
ncbi:MAG: outer membrane protein assembly factor BamB family protein [Anaerolineae bacterium]